MLKTDIKKTASEDVAELSDEALDRTAEDAQACQGGCADCICWSPAE
ncbi:MAG: hypothetical protein ISR48_03100 [Alphaproteobacteria bacterium]|nr:hypothetical protein [Alphaproteobacteria bacterium]